MLIENSAHLDFKLTEVFFYQVSNHFITCLA